MSGSIFVCLLLARLLFVNIQCLYFSIIRAPCFRLAVPSNGLCYCLEQLMLSCAVLAVLSLSSLFINAEVLRKCYCTNLSISSSKPSNIQGAEHLPCPALSSFHPSHMRDVAVLSVSVYSAALSLANLAGVRNYGPLFRHPSERHPNTLHK